MSKSFVLALPCGVRMDVHLLEGTREHNNEFVWCVEGTKVHGRGYDQDFNKAKQLGFACIRSVLTESESLLVKNGG